MISISLNVTHAPWIPERVATMKTLRKRLGVIEREYIIVADLTGEPRDEKMETFTPAGPYAEETTRAPAWTWQTLQLQWSLEQKTDWHFFAQDDDIVPSETVDGGSAFSAYERSFFWDSLRAMCEGCGRDVICLHNGHPAARTLFTAGASGYTTSDGLVGQFFGAKHDVIKSYDAWRLSAVDKPVTRKLIKTNGLLGEDTLFGMFCMDEGIRIFHPLPTLYDHDTSIASTNDGYDSHLYRAPQVCWYDAHRAQHEIGWGDPKWWGSKVFHLGRFYEASHKMLPGVLRDKTRGAELVEKYRGDTCPKAYERFFHRVHG